MSLSLTWEAFAQPAEREMRGLRHAIRQYLNLEVSAVTYFMCQNVIDLISCPDFQAIQAEQETTIEKSEEVEKIKAHILAHLEQPLSRDGVAERFYMSPAYFSRYFKRMCGCSFYEFVRDARMEKAMSLLKTKRHMQKICEAVGYHDKAYFYKIFQQYTGMTPSEYRRSICDDDIFGNSGGNA